MLTSCQAVEPILLDAQMGTVPFQKYPVPHHRKATMATLSTLPWNLTEGFFPVWTSFLGGLDWLVGLNPGSCAGKWLRPPRLQATCPPPRIQATNPSQKLEKLGP